jgi:hypothetical protein
MLLCHQVIVSAQSGESIFRLVEMKADTLTFNSINHMVDYNNLKHLFFIYDNENEVVEIALDPRNKEIRDMKIIPSADFDQVDSMVFAGDSWHTKLRFKNITRSEFLKLQVKYVSDGTEKTEIIRLLPCTRTSVSIKPGTDELFIGEEKVFDIVTNNAENLRFPSEWTSGLDIDYRIEKQDDQVKLHVIPNVIGTHKLIVNLITEKPNIDIQSHRVYNQAPEIQFDFNVKNSRLKFLGMDKREVTMDENSRRQGVEIQLDNSRQLELNKTYRVENQENPGGTLIAELFTRSSLSTNKVLCYLRTYNYHRNSEGYLYIKNGDDALFITNVDITPATSISKISVMHGGGEWTTDLSVYPGETIGLKIEGQSLNKARFHVEELNALNPDTLIQNENEMEVRLNVPLNISQKRINLYNHSTPTGYAFTVKEYENPRPFDYVTVNYGDMNRTVSGIHGPILYSKAVRDVIISFNPDKIDSDNRLFGRQYLTVDVRITGPNNELIDMRTIGNIVVCPSDKSPRYRYYDKRNCNQNDISLNKYIRRSTNDLDDWSRINLSLKTNPDKYGGESQEKDIEIILKKKYKFDIDVSFPAGLITVSEDSEDPSKTSFSNLYGISMAMVAQFAFYNPDKIAKLRPYRVGAGFIALDAFNFQSESQDLAVVMLGSLYPTTRDKKLAFPLYIGGGYQFKAQKWMMLIGPGISIKL